MADAAAVDALVEAKLTQMDSIATEAIQDAQDFLDQMIYNMPNNPEYSFTTDMPLDIQDNPIDADEPERPNIENLVDDTHLPPSEDIVYPLEPGDAETALPAAVTLEDIAIPSDITVKTFPFPSESEFPSDDDIDSTVINPFDYSEAEYVSSLLDAVKSKLESDVENGGTGLDPDVEQAIFERGQEREDIQNELDLNKIKAIWSNNLFTLPNGALVELEKKYINDYDNSKLDRSRDIAIKQAELAQVNTHFAITSSISLEGILIQHADNVANRALEAAKSIVNFGIATFNVQVQRYQSAIDAYKTKVQIVSEKIRAEGLEVSNYTARMQGAKIKADVQGQRVSNYREQIAAIGQIYDNYKTQIQAVGVKAQVEADKLRAFRVRIEAQLDKVRGLVAIYEADTNRYGTNIRKGAVEGEIKLKQQSLISSNHEANLRLAISNARTNLEAFARNAEMKINASIRGANAYSTLAAGAMDSLNSVVQLGSTSTVSATETA